MHISEASVRSGLPAKTIRYYEEVGLVEKPQRTSSGYRQYKNRDVHILQFIHRARDLGFSVEECRELLGLYSDGQRASADVKRLVMRRLDQIDEKVRQLRQMRTTLQHLAEQCHGDDRPDCPILDELADGEVQ